jgi:hypothetical protein
VILVDASSYALALGREATFPRVDLDLRAKRRDRRPPAGALVEREQVFRRVDRAASDERSRRASLVIAAWLTTKRERDLSGRLETSTPANTREIGGDPDESGLLVQLEHDRNWDPARTLGG